MRVQLAAVACALIATLGGCASVDEFRRLEREVVELKRTRNVPSDQQQRVADLGVEARELREELARLQGTIEELQFSVQEIQQELASRGRGTTGPGSTGEPFGVDAEEVPGAEGSSGVGGIGADPGSTSSLGPTGSLPASSISAEVSAYEKAFTLYRSGDHSAAIGAFREFLNKYPSSGYADNALFWLGDCYFKVGDFASAAVAFEDVAKKYPDGNKVPDALYRQGLALLEIGGKSGQEAAYRGAAQEIFQKILDVYPDSERAPEARRQLEKLGT